MWQALCKDTLSYYSQNPEMDISNYSFIVDTQKSFVLSKITGRVRTGFELRIQECPHSQCFTGAKCH